MIISVASVELSATSVRSAAIAASARRATVADAAAIADLVNQAYRAEAFFVDGNRTSAAEICELLAEGEFLVIDGPRGLAGSIFVDAYGATATAAASPSDVAVTSDVGRSAVKHAKISMVSVDPEMQRVGIGRRLVAIAEALSSALGCDAVTLDVVSAREDLLRWYRGLGYREIGAAPYLHRPTKMPCHFVLFEKLLPVSDN